MILSSSITSLILIAVAVISYIAIGKFFSDKKILTGALLALASSALILAIFANFCAGLIRPFAVMMILIGLILFFKGAKEIKIRKQNWPFVLFLIAISILIYLFNNPQTVFFEGKNFLFNSHYSYYSGQSVEMLKATYISRLRLFEFYPHQWLSYHFFNSAVQAALSALIPNPNILSYFNAQVVIVILIIGALFENIFATFGFSWKNILISLIWFSLGFTAFGHVISWNFLTSGTFSIFASVMIFLSIYKKDTDSFLMYSLILGVSAFRLMPISLVILVLVFLWIFAKQTGSLSNKSTEAVKKLFGDWKVKIFFSLFIFYGLATLLLAPGSSDTVLDGAFTNKVINAGWDSVLTFYKLLGFIGYKFGRVAISTSGFNDLGYISHLIDYPLLSYLMYGALVALAVLILIWFFKLAKRNLTAVLIIAPIAILALIIGNLVVPSIHRLLILIGVPYLFLILMILESFGQTKQEKTGFMIFYLWVFVVATALQFIGLPFQVKVPIIFIVYDVFLWAAVGIYLFGVKKNKLLVLTLIIVLIFISSFKFHFIGMFRSDSHEKIEISDLIDKGVKVEDYYEAGSRLCRNIDGSPNTKAAYAALVGCALKYDQLNSTLMSYPFVQK